MLKTLSNQKLEESINHLLEDVFSVLSEREIKVIKSRYGIGGKKLALSAIGRDFKLSRERVRQLESEAKRKLKLKINSDLKNHYQNLSVIVVDNGGILSETKLEKIFNDAAEDRKNFAKLMFDLDENLRRIKNHQHLKNGWVSLKHSEDDLLELLNRATMLLSELKQSAKFQQIKSKIVDADELGEEVMLSLLESANQIIVTRDGQFGLISNREINPKTISDKIQYVLNEAKKPLHFTEISKRISEIEYNRKKFNQSTVHNELIANDAFVLIGRGIYALKKWGYKPGTISEVILNYLSNCQKPQSLAQIMEHISKQRQVKKNTVLVNLKKLKQVSKTASGEYYFHA